MMQKNLAQIMVYGLTEPSLLENIEVNRRIIHEVVENWNRKIYIVPPQALGISRQITYSSQHRLM